jgi:hypothetical protein
MSNTKGSHKARKKKDERPENDTYHTPFSLTWRLMEVEHLYSVLEPACGLGAISKPLTDAGISVIAKDIKDGEDFLKYNSNKIFESIVTNPPFDLWDEFVIKAKELRPNKICFIGQTDYFSTYSRSTSGIWKNLKTVHIFNRKVDYRTPYREDGKFHVGAMTTGWFVWEKGYLDLPRFNFIDVQEYAKLGQFPTNKKEKQNEYNLPRM